MNPTRFIRRSTLLLCLTGVALMALAPSATAKPHARTVTFEHPAALMGLANIGTVETQLDALNAYMTLVGLPPLPVDQLRIEIAEFMGLKKGVSVAGVGLDPAGSIMMSVASSERRPHIVVTVDILNEKKFIQHLKKLIETDQWVDEGEKPKKAEIVRRERPGKSVARTIRLKGRTRGLELVIQDGVAVMGPTPEAVDAVVFSETDRLTRPVPKGHIAGFFQVAGAEAALLDRDFRFINGVKFAEGVGTIGASGFEGWGRMDIAPDLSPMTPPFSPSPKGTDARAAMAKMAGAGTGAWSRISFDLDETYTLLGALMGAERDEMTKAAKSDLGLNLKRDIIEGLTGDILFALIDGFPSAVIAFGAKDGARTGKTFDRLMGALLELDTQGSVRRTTSRAIRVDGGTRFETTFWEADAKGHREDDLFTLHWGTQKSLLVLGLTPDGVRHALARDAAPEAQMPAGFAAKAFSADTLWAAYGVVQEPMNFLRQIMPLIRAYLPKQEREIINIFRVFETFQALSDRLVDSAMDISRDGQDIVGRLSIRALPTEGSAAFDAAADAKITESLAHRYQGRVLASNSILMSIAAPHAADLYGKKATSLALAGDSPTVALQIASFVGLLGSRWFGMSSMLGSSPDYYKESTAVEAASPACQMLRVMGCDTNTPEFYSAERCAIADREDDTACSAELEIIFAPAEENAE